MSEPKREAKVEKKKKPIMKTKSAVILIFILLIAIGLGTYKIARDYQKEQENPPIMYVVGENGRKVEMIPIEYSWTYKGETKQYKMEESFLELDYSEKNTVYLDSNNVSSFVATTNEKYKVDSGFQNIYEYSDGGYFEKQGGTIGARDRVNPNFGSLSSVADSITKYYVKYAKQGYVTYAVKTTVFNKETAQIAKNYIGTKLTEEKKIKELVSKIEYKEVFKNAKIEGNNLTLEYEYYPLENLMDMDNVILFSCIEDLETITYTATNKKTFYNKKGEDGIWKTVKEELENFVVNREKYTGTNAINVDNLLHYMKEEV